MKKSIIKICLVVCATACWSLPASAQFLPRGITQVTDNLYWAHQDSHRTVFLVTSEGVILADPISTEFAGWLKQEIQDRFGMPVRYVIYSHHHWDHVSGGAVFEDTATFVGHENMLHNLANAPAETPASEEGSLADVRPPDVTFRDQSSVTLGGQEARLIHVGNMLHSDDMSAIVFPGERAVFVVDFITTGRLPYVDYFPGFVAQGIQPEDLDSWLNAIRMVEMLDVDIVAPGHGSIGTIADVTEHRHYLEDLRDTVRAGVARGDSLDEIQQSPVFAQYAHLFNYDDWLAIQIESMYQMITQQ